MIAPHGNWAQENDESVSAMKELVDEFYAAKLEAEKAERRFKDLKAKLLQKMEDEGMARFDADTCFVTLNEKKYVSMPKTDEDKEILFAWLNHKKIFLDSVSVNYQTLNSLYKEQKKLGKEIPGIGPEASKFELRSYKRK